MPTANTPSPAEPSWPSSGDEDRRFVGLVRNFLGVFDAIIEYADTSQDPRVQRLGQEVLRTLLGQGVRPVARVGGRFDPRHHEALAVEASGELPADTIVQVVQPGFQWVPPDRPPVLLRSAKVIVTPAAPPEAPAEGSTSSRQQEEL